MWSGDNRRDKGDRRISNRMGGLAHRRDIGDRISNLLGGVLDHRRDIDDRISNWLAGVIPHGMGLGACNASVALNFRDKSALLVVPVTLIHTHLVYRIFFNIFNFISSPSYKP